MANPESCPDRVRAGLHFTVFTLLYMGGVPAMGGIHIDAAGLGGYGHADAAGKAALVCAVNVRDDFSTTNQLIPKLAGAATRYLE